ncbi:MAG: hypothetical protein Q4E67_04905 [Planctomycetia bacterium]|nr:hypothetical protein [Planctomycetia bacterium]
MVFGKKKVLTDNEPGNDLASASWERSAVSAVSAASVVWRMWWHLRWQRPLGRSADTLGNVPKDDLFWVNGEK